MIVVTYQAMHKDGSQSKECSTTASLPSDNDPFTITFNVLETIARENGFAIQYVPYDGDLHSTPAEIYFSKQYGQEYTEANGSSPLGK